jgi:hypothetical protein
MLFFTNLSIHYSGVQGPLDPKGISGPRNISQVSSSTLDFTTALSLLFEDEPVPDDDSSPPQADEIPESRLLKTKMAALN